MSSFNGIPTAELRRRDLMEAIDRQDYSLYRSLLENDLSTIMADTPCPKLPSEQPKTGLASSTFLA